ncbi:MAG: SRPBCC family protein [Bradymonadaceae bacterium]|nr:SRPBCC family protein [Lujinxingiaceae bacterium]
MAQQSDEMMKTDEKGALLKDKLSNMSPGQVAPLVGGGALILLGLSRRSIGGLLVAAAGGTLLFQQLRGRNGLSLQGGQMIELEESVVVNQPVEEVYEFWCNFENFPRFMEHIESIQKIDDRLSHWEAAVPVTNQTIDWDAEIIEMRENELIRWSSIQGADIYNEGTVRFRRLANGQGTEVTARICYKPPAGVLGKIVGQFLNAIPASFIKNDMERFKRLVETETDTGMIGDVTL